MYFFVCLDRLKVPVLTVIDSVLRLLFAQIEGNVFPLLFSGIYTSILVIILQFWSLAGHGDTCIEICIEKERAAKNVSLS